MCEIVSTTGWWVSMRRVRAGADVHLTGRQGGADVQRIGRVGAAGRPRAVQQPLVDHVPGAVEALLAGLEHEQDPPRELVAALREHPHGGGEHCDVGVVAAGVHAAVHLGGEGQAGVLGQRQRVHVAAQQHRGAAPLALQHGHHRADRTAEVHLYRQVGQRGDHRIARARQVESELGMPLQGATQRDRARLDAARLRVQTGERGDVRRHGDDPRTSAR
jgi:hypothetical protein